MKELYIKQKVFSLGEKFTVKDDQENDVYFVEGSFMKIPPFIVMNNNMLRSIIRYLHEHS